MDDISWGTKQEGAIETDLGAVVQDRNFQVDLEMASSSAEESYAKALESIKRMQPIQQREKVLTIAEQQQAAKDYYASVRTNVSVQIRVCNHHTKAFVSRTGSHRMGTLQCKLLPLIRQ